MNERDEFIFINYRRADSTAEVDRLRERLVCFVDEARVFVDRPSVVIGDDWARAIREGMAKATCMVVVIGKEWLHQHDRRSGVRRLDEPGDWVREEIEFALREDTPITIIPFLAGEATMPPEEDLPESIKSLSKVKGATSISAVVERVLQLDGRTPRSVAQVKTLAALEEALVAAGYDPDDDVRRQRSEALATRLRPHGVLLVGGEPGCGMSWTGYALANALARAHPPISQAACVLLIRDRSNPEAVLKELARQVWCGLLHRPEPVRGGIRKVLAQAKELGCRCVTVVDGMDDRDSARQLIKYDLPGRGVELVLVGWEGDVPPGDCSLARIERFSPGDLSRYLARNDLDVRQVPPEVATALRSPRMAAIYTELAGTGGWQPRHEHALFARFWSQNLEDDGFGDDEVILDLCRSWLDSERSYPVPADDYLESEIQRLTSSGWARLTDDVCLAVDNNRLLSWAVAKAVVGDYEDGETPVEEVAGLMAGAHRARSDGNAGHLRALGDLPSDAIWFLTRLEVEVAVPVVLAYVRDLHAGYPWPQTEVPRRWVPLLVAALRELGAEEDKEGARLVSRALQSVEGESENLGQVGRDLLREDSVSLRIAGARLLAAHPTAKGLDDLWRLFCEVEFGDLVQRQPCWKALWACAGVENDWLRGKLQAAERGTPGLSRLIQLVAAAPAPEQLWRETKEGLLEAAEGDRDAEESIMFAALICSDRSDVRWLRQCWTPDRLDEGAIQLVQALIRLDPHWLLEHLPAEARRDGIQRASSTWLPRLRLLYGDALNTRLLESMGDGADLWNLCLIYQGQEDELDLSSLRAFLQALVTPFKEAVEAKTAGTESMKWLTLRALDMLADTRTPQQILEFRRHRGGALDSALASWLGAAFRSDQPWEGAARTAAVAERIGGMALRAMLEALLERATVQSLADASRVLERVEEPALLHRLVEKIVARARDGRRWPTKAARVVAASGEWEQLIDFVLEFPLPLAGDLHNLCRGLGRPGAEAANRAWTAVRERGPVPGALLAVAMTGRIEAGEAVKAALAAAEMGSIDALVAVDAAFLLDDYVAVPAEQVARHLGDSAAGRLAAYYLAGDGSAAGRRILLERVRRDYDDFQAGLLLGYEDTREAVARLRWQKIQAGERPPRYLAWVASLRWCKEEGVRAFLESAAADSISSSGGESLTPSARTIAAVIEALGHHNREFAVELCETMYQTGRPEARAAAAGLRARLDPDSAAGPLLEAARHEPRQLVMSAIAAALADIDVEPQLLDWLEGRDRRLRYSAAHLLRGRRLSAEGRARVLKVALDPRVKDYGIQILDYDARISRVEDLTRAMGSSRSRQERWLYLRALAAQSRVRGTRLQPPLRDELFVDALAVCTRSQRRHLRKALKENRQRWERCTDKVEG